ncbi:NUDIX hydrolase [Dyadobacter sp. CY312]|uniref:NUDIX domain-containing protein n=1 Tax=Dyadobacter sp. CY312 TaxID=2907303 RepID=UPI001F166C46|nr:NUDIX hydrolase [Dyadobacter sp. CY312]MCE7039513.1 NUDIX hydrolase [Dyadobacter sp. CY312]
METPVAAVKELYGNQVRIRVCGICMRDNKILLVNHKLYGEGSDFWSPPGGGVHFGETVVKAMGREFEEETGLLATVGELLFMNEFIQAPLHAIELFFRIDSIEGNLTLGTDPEFQQNEQIIQEVKFFGFEELQRIPGRSKHRIFNTLKRFEDLFEKKELLFHSTFNI